MSFVFDSTSEDDSKLFKLLASASLRRDDKAPLYPTAATLETFENREDMKALRAQRRHFREELKLSADNREVKQLTAKIGDLRTVLSNLAVKQARENYFAEVDSLRARGLSTEDMPAPPPNPFRCSFGPSLPAATIIGRYLNPKDPASDTATKMVFPNSTDSGSDQTTQKRLAVSEMLFAYLNDRYGEVEGIAQEMEQPASEHKKAASTLSTCLLCLQSFTRRRNLSRHHRSVHFTATTFEPFSCPECQRQGKEEYRIERASEWSNHVERVHGFINTPVLFTKPIVKPKPMATTTKSKSAPCLRCGQLFYAGNSLSRHMNKYHRIVEPFDCPKCKGEGENIQINDLASWLTHTSDVHGCNGQTGVVIDKECLPKQGQKKRKRENIVEEAIKRSKLES
ncbi:hypothetical protein B0H65DRAFT_217433 [Neurospora tetraspora]|uniref:C2H2-type domain-containing protein n=1 Tax=Neurospora tetraspora TaxID=94610 RepID=A0AAE0JCN2_9PEZI|nr:hypothetical protein B0H65DRAFT_217433 [Neurospora tetraspora]